MKDHKLTYSIIALLILGIGVYTYDNTQKRNVAKQENCTEIGLKLGEKNRERLKNTGQDQTDFYEDEYAYNKTLRTCLYYKSQTPFLYDTENEVAISSREIIDASTNEKIITLLEVLNPEGLDEKFENPSCISYHKSFECNARGDFNKIKAELLRQP